MTLRHIQDQIESYGYMVALDAYLLAMQHARELHSENKSLPDSDELQDQLQELARTKLQGQQARKE